MIEKDGDGAVGASFRCDRGGAPGVRRTSLEERDYEGRVCVELQFEGTIGWPFLWRGGRVKQWVSRLTDKARRITYLGFSF